MTSPSPQTDREKVVSKLPLPLRQKLKIRTAQLRVDIQDAVADGITAWRALGSNLPAIPTGGADSFSTWLPEGLWEGFREDCTARGVSLVQGLAQSVQLWLETNPAPEHVRPAIVRRKLFCNQKGGVGKTAMAAGVGQALAEDPEALHPVARLDEPYSARDENTFDELPGLGLRVLIVDYDPQCHLTVQLGLQKLPIAGDSLCKHMGGEPKGDLRDVIVTVKSDRFGGRLDVLPGCRDAFLMDVSISRVRAREASLERALAPVEADYDVIIVDCPPSLGMSMDAAVYYSRRRDGEDPGASGAAIVVQAEDTSADAYEMLTEQIQDLRRDLRIDVNYLGIIVNLYDARRGYIATSSLAEWRAIEDPRVVAVLPDLKEQREAVRMKEPLLEYDPRCEQSARMRALAREI